MAFDITRRLFLRGAAIAAPALAIPATAVLASSYVEENADLLALEPELDVVLAEATAAKAAYLEARRIGEGLWPRAPELITYPSKYGTPERGITGAAYINGMSVLDEDTLRRDVKILMRKRKITAQLEDDRARAQERVALFEAYEADCARAKAVSGHDAADDRWTGAAKALFHIVDRVQGEPCKTMAGIRLKAKALDGWDKNARHFERMLNADGRDGWMPNFCRALMEVLEAS